MSDYEARLARLRVDDSRDHELISAARTRMHARQEEMKLLGESIVAGHLTNGSLSNRLLERVRSNTESHGAEAMHCQACHSQPDDPVLNSCGHFYCSEHWEQLQTQCMVESCGKRLRNETAMEFDLYDAMCAKFTISFTTENNQSEPKEELHEDDDSSYEEEEENVETPRASRFNRNLLSRQNNHTQPVHLQLHQTNPATDIEDDSEDDGFDNRSQRSQDYDDDNNSFVEDDGIANENMSSDSSGSGSEDLSDVHMEDIGQEIEDLE